MQASWVVSSAEVLRTLEALAELQAGVVTREQATAHGVSPMTAYPEDVVGWVTLAVERRRTTSRRLQRALAGRRRHPRRELLDGLSRQLTSRTHQAVRDVWYTEIGVVVELDGRLGHTELGRFRDMDRDDEASLDGLLTLRFGAGDLHGRPCGVAAKVVRALHQRGWSGLPTRCRRCRAMPDSDQG